MHPRLQEMIDYATAQRRALLAAWDAVPAERWAERPTPNAWSPGELAEHLYMVEHSCARAVAKKAAEARAAGCPPERDTSSMMHALDDRGLTDRSRKLEAPERVRPTGGWTRERSLDALATSRAELLDAARAGDGLALGTVIQTHARLGEIDLYQWILFVAQHEARHVPQAAEIAAQLSGAGQAAASNPSLSETVS
jgi:hypothetical protein